MEENVESINKQIALLRKRGNEIEKAEFKDKTLPEIKELFGKTFVYRKNSYSCPEKPSDYWDVFRRIVCVLENQGAAWLVCEECQIDSNGRPSLVIESRLVNVANMGAGWSRCAPKEYEQMRALVLAAIDSPDAYVAYLARP